MYRTSTTGYNLIIMKNLIVLGNWKANKTISEAQDWIKKFSIENSNIKVILCPAFHHLSLFIEAKLSIALGSQDISEHPSGAYTGEISAEMLTGLVKYALIGHSERRKNYGETNEMVGRKVKVCLRANIAPIVCISEIEQAVNLKELVPDFTRQGILLYEPLFAIGTGQTDTPEHANEMAIQLQQILGDVPILYGGSISPDNIQQFIGKSALSGVGVGGSSLDAIKFSDLINKTAKLQ